jgi:predicted nucleic acid-binding protein
MNGNKLFIDTNIALYLLSGDETLSILLQDKQIYISFITQLELLGFKPLTDKEEKIIRAFIDQCTIVDINNSIKETTIELRKDYKVKLPDSIIMATSIYLGVPLLTSDIDFKKVVEIDLLYYENNQ